MFRKSLLLALFASTQCFAGVPSQFIAKQYTEALGRAPDPGAWQSAINYYTPQKSIFSVACTRDTLRSFATSIFNSSEYTQKNYTAQEKVLTLYRAIFSREPDPTGFDFWVGRLNAGVSISTVIEGFMDPASNDFTDAVVKNICDGKAYGPIGALAAPVDLNKTGTWDQARIEACINDNAVCSVPPRTLVLLTRPLVVRQGKTLETAGGYDRRSYARQARFVRQISDQVTPWKGIMIVMEPGSTVRNIWISGERARYLQKMGRVQRDGDPEANVFANIYYGGGYYGTIEGVRSDGALSGTHIATRPLPPPAQPIPASSFDGIVSIGNNLTTGYEHDHYRSADWRDGDLENWADGISHHIANGFIYDNDIVDPTDAGIVMFTHDGVNQASSAYNNVIVHAGKSAFGSIGLDATQCVNSRPDSCTFSGSGFTNNTIFAGQIQHSDIMLFNGTGAWIPPKCTSTPDGSYGYCASGGQISNNTNIMDDNLAINVQVGLMVDGMLNASTGGNNMKVKKMGAPADVPDNRTVLLKCSAMDSSYEVRNALNKTTAPADIHASGVLEAGVNVDSDGCTGH
jgi:hypothetical protein